VEMLVRQISRRGRACVESSNLSVYSSNTVFFLSETNVSGRRKTNFSAKPNLQVQLNLHVRRGSCLSEHLITKPEASGIAW